MFQDYLNEKLQECFLQRIRHAMKPDEAFGLIFSWDNVIVSFLLVLVYQILVSWFLNGILEFSFLQLWTVKIMQTKSKLTLDIFQLLSGLMHLWVLFAVSFVHAWMYNLQNIFIICCGLTDWHVMSVFILLGWYRLAKVECLETACFGGRYVYKQSHAFM